MENIVADTIWQEEIQKFRWMSNWYAKYENFVNENLTNSNHELAFNCHKLKWEKLILKTYSSNGIIHIVQIQ